jgi:hypothetical protein
MSDIESEKPKDSGHYDNSSWRKKITHLNWPKITMPHWYWPWWIIAAIIVATLMAISYFSGMLSTISHAHTLLSSLHQQLHLVALQRAELDKQAKALGVLADLNSGHWSSPAVWAIFLPMWLWFALGMAAGIGALTGIRHWRGKKFVQAATPARYSPPAHVYAPTPAPLPEADQNVPRRHTTAESEHHPWVREFVGLVVWAAVISSVVFIVVHTGIVSGYLPKQLSLPASWHLAPPSWLHP